MFLMVSGFVLDQFKLQAFTNVQNVFKNKSGRWERESEGGGALPP